MQGFLHRRHAYLTSMVCTCTFRSINNGLRELQKAFVYVYANTLVEQKIAKIDR